MDRRSLLLAPLALIAACSTHMSGNLPPHAALADMRDGLGTQVGTARLVERRNRMVLVLELRGMAHGPHAIHLHAVGVCDGPGFTTAGPHLNPEGRQHGSRNRAGAHMGDMPNVKANRGGWIREEIVLDTPAAILKPHLFDSDGTAVVLHERRDDYRTDPSGNSGNRIACGVLRRQ